MNILQINCVYGVGSTGNITRDLHQALLARGHRSAVHRLWLHRARLQAL